MAEAKVLCRTPTPGKSTKHIDKWKYDLVRGAIRKVVPKALTGVAFSELPGLVGNALSPAERARLGSVAWYTTTVKLHMETTGELERVAGAHPQRIRRTA
jgi:tRNA A37 threonylcarbamoyltransferase TsaD